MSNAKNTPHCIQVLRRGLAEGAFPSAAVAVGQGRKVYFCEAMGNREEKPKPHKAHKSTLYDLASLTKLVAPTMIALRLVEEGKLLLSDTLDRYFTAEELKNAPAGRAGVTILQLMTHTSGITPHFPLWLTTVDGVYGASTGQTGTSDENTTEPFVAHEEQSEETVREEQPEETIREEQPEETVREEQPEETVHEEQPEETVREEQPEETVHEEQPEETVHEEQPEETVHEEQPEETVHEEQPEETIHEEQPQETAAEAQTEEMVGGENVAEAAPEASVETVPHVKMSEKTSKEKAKGKHKKKNKNEIRETLPQGLVSNAITPEQAVEAILASAPVCEPGAEVHYSCMGYILLGKILERITGTSLDKLAKQMVFQPLGMKHTEYCPKGHDIATTEYSEMRGKYICGEVHDENAHFLGGVSANAGVFAPIGDMIQFAMMLAERGKTSSGQFLSPATFDLAVNNFTPTLSEARGLGFQLQPPMPALTSMGDLMSEGSYGHTGFTGTSLFVDAKTGRWAILLTNAVHYGRDKTAFLRYRRLFHNAVMSDYFGK